GSSAQCATNSRLQLSATLRKQLPRQPTAASNPHRLTGSHRCPAGSFFGGFPTPASLTRVDAHAGPASETLHVSGRSATSRTPKLSLNSAVRRLIVTRRGRLRS